MNRLVLFFAISSAAAFGQRPADTLKKLPKTQKLVDFAAYFSASAAFESGDDAAALEVIKPLWTMSPRSPMAGRGALLAARAYIRSGHPQYAIDTLKNFASELAQPEGDLALAKAAEAAGDGLTAATYYQRVYYNFPAADAAAEAAEGMARVQKIAPTPQMALMRADKLMAAGQNRQAKTELTALLPALTGADRDAGRLKIGAAQYNMRENAPALAYFRGLELADGEADAERLFWVIQCARRLNNRDEVSRALEQLASKYPRSKWRVDSLVNAAAYHVVANQAEAYEPLFRSCYADFPDSPRAPECHWRVTFNEYLRRGPNAASMLLAHTRAYPKSDHVPAALYFLGRLAEQSANPGSARAYFEAVDRTYPNHYYAVLCRERMRVSGKTSTARGSQQFLPNAISQFRIDRANLLADAGLDELADIELRYGASKEDQPAVMGMALARLALKREMPEKAIRYMKRYAPNYLMMPFDSAPAEFWQLAFPLPYREYVERYAKQEELDPFLMAALIRQESEFDARVVSHAKAYGLTQVLPSTGRELARKAGIKPFTARMLFRPELNLQFGSRYLRMMLDGLENRLEATLAAYNAGKSRSVSWLSWFDYREPAEFVESIPFNETRTYVQAVIRNADIYRRLYGTAPQQAANNKP